MKFSGQLLCYLLNISTVHCFIQTACLEYGVDEDDQKKALSLLGRLDSSWTSDRYKVSPVGMSETELNEGIFVKLPFTRNVYI